MDPKLRYGHKKNATLVLSQFNLVHTFVLLYGIYPLAPLTQSVSLLEDYRWLVSLLIFLCRIWGFHSSGYEEFYLQGYNASLLPSSRWFHPWFIPRPWRCRRLVLPKPRFTFSGLHGVVTQKIEFFYEHSYRHRSLFVCVFICEVGYKCLHPTPRYETHSSVHLNSWLVFVIFLTIRWRVILCKFTGAVTDDPKSTVDMYSCCLKLRQRRKLLTAASDRPSEWNNSNESASTTTMERSGCVSKEINEVQTIRETCTIHMNPL